MSLSDYILSVLSIAVLISLCRAILPDGRTKHAVGTIFHFILIIAIISPLSNINKDISVDFNTSKVSIDESAVYEINLQKITYLESSCLKILNQNDVTAEDVEIEFNINDKNYLIEKVTVFFDNSRITDETEHINIIRKTKSLLSELLAVGEGAITVERR